MQREDFLSNRIGEVKSNMIFYYWTREGERKKIGKNNKRSKYFDQCYNYKSLRTLTKMRKELPNGSTKAPVGKEIMSPNKVLIEAGA